MTEKNMAQNTQYTKTKDGATVISLRCFSKSKNLYKKKMMKKLKQVNYVFKKILDRNRIMKCNYGIRKYTLQTTVI